MAAKEGTKDLAATKNARTAFQDFLFRYPNSEKAAQARANVKTLEHKQSSSAFDVAKFYDKQKHYRAAVIYYNEVIREQPGSAESEQAQKRINQLRAKLGDAVMEAVQAEANKKPASPKSKNDSSSPAAANKGPLPPTESDVSLPPPASLAPNTTTAPEPFPSSGSSSSLEPLPSPSPDAASSPVP